MDLKQSVFIATSMDGFIARPDGDIEWLHTIEEMEGEDYGYKNFMDSVDALVMGRKTYEKVLDFEKWPYEEQVFVLSHEEVPIPSRLSDRVKITSGSPHQIVEQLSASGFKHLYIDGGKTIQGFLNQGLIQEITVTRIPILIGKGISLFGTLETDLKLDHLSTSVYKNGFVQSRYHIRHNA